MHLHPAPADCPADPTWIQVRGRLDQFGLYPTVTDTTQPFGDDVATYLSFSPAVVAGLVFDPADPMWYGNDRTRRACTWWFFSSGWVEDGRAEEGRGTGSTLHGGRVRGAGSGAAGCWSAPRLGLRVIAGAVAPVLSLLESDLSSDNDQAALLRINFPVWAPPPCSNKPSARPAFQGVQLEVPASAVRWPSMLFMTSRAQPPDFAPGPANWGSWWQNETTQFCALFTPEMALPPRSPDAPSVHNLTCRGGGELPAKAMPAPGGIASVQL